MRFQIQPIALGAAAAALSVHDASSAFADVEFSTYNRIKFDKGQIAVEVGGKEVRRAPSVRLVIAGFEHASWKTMRRVFYKDAYVPGTKAGAPDCTSADGETPTAWTGDAPQQSACKDCAHSAKQGDKPARCALRKTLLVYLVESTPDNDIDIDLQTPYAFDAPSMTLFSQYDAQGTQSGGSHSIVPLLVKSGVRTIEGVVFELGFFQGAMAPVFRVAGQLPADAVPHVLAAAKTAEAIAVTAPRTAKPQAAALSTTTTTTTATATAPLLTPPPAPAAFTTPPAPAAFDPPPAPAAFTPPPAPAAFTTPPAPAAAAAPASAPAPTAATPDTERRAAALGAFGQLMGGVGQ